MKTFACLFLVAVSLIADAYAKGVPPEIRREYAKMNAARIKKDVNGLAKAMTPGFVFYGSHNKRLDHDATVAHEKQIMAALNLSRIRTVVTGAVFKGRTAIVNTTTDLSGTIKTADGKVHKTSDQSSSIDTWVQTSKGWRIASSREEAARQTLDGRTFDPAEEMRRREKKTER